MNGDGGSRVFPSGEALSLTGSTPSSTQGVDAMEETGGQECHNNAKVPQRRFSLPLMVAAAEFRCC
jgi:hypothetical protein